MFKKGLFLLAISLGFFSSYAQEEEEKTSTTYSFNPLKVLRDPFIPSKDIQKKKINELFAFEITQMNLVAVLTGMGAPKAMLLLPNKSTHIVQRGDSLGKRKGIVQKISDKELVVEEKFVDYKGRQKKSMISLVMAH